MLVYFRAILYDTMTWVTTMYGEKRSTLSHFTACTYTVACTSVSVWNPLAVIKVSASKTTDFVKRRTGGFSSVYVWLCCGLLGRAIVYPLVWLTNPIRHRERCPSHSWWNHRLCEFLQYNSNYLFVDVTKRKKICEKLLCD